MRDDVGWEIVLLMLGVVIGSLWFASREPALPTPPDLTVAEMRQRESDFLSGHCETCKVCLSERDDPVQGRVVAYCDEGLRTLARAQVVGDWVEITRSPVRPYWQYVGRPIPGWRWNVLRQLWQQERNK
jgi:hypothetical protein